jgi:SH3-like domain-containing protein
MVSGAILRVKKISQPGSEFWRRNKISPGSEFWIRNKIYPGSRSNIKSQKDKSSRIGILEPE